MTRKCVLCKESNYKRMYSFFSAPKDPATRQKWQEVIPIEDYTVSDETYVCSKHFQHSDIITHWVSGVPPNVITPNWSINFDDALHCNKIKYKKCRLRPGAVPCTDLQSICSEPNSPVETKTSQHARLRINNFPITGEESMNSTSKQAKKGMFIISREEERLSNSSEICVASKVGKYFTSAQDKTYIRQSQREKSETCSLTNERSTVCVKYRQFKGQHLEKNNEHFENRNEETIEDEYNRFRSANTMHSKGSLEGNPNNLIHHQQDFDQSNDELGSVALLSKEVVIERNSSSPKDEVTEYDETSTEMWEAENVKLENEKFNDGLESDLDGIEKQELENRIMDASEYDHQDEHDVAAYVVSQANTMLFEDLLEMYTEVTIPRGWSFILTSKGHSTTVIYLYMNMPTNGMPVVEKQVFIKSDMIMRCGAASREINPFVHNLVREGRNIKVQALSDLEELIEEFDMRTVCEGGPADCSEDVNVQVACKEGPKWRHVSCSIIINNGSSSCSKCATLSNTLSQWNTRKRKTLKSDDLLQKKIQNLQRTLRKMTKRNQKLEEIRANFRHKFRLLLSDPQKTFASTIDTSNMPKIQKLMVKECLKASTIDNKKNVRYSETWVFLCLLLYVESPRMYRYMLLNNYMTLPSMRTIRRYLHQIKTDQQFYNLFQQSVEPFQPAVEGGGEKESAER